MSPLCFLLSVLPLCFVSVLSPAWFLYLPLLSSRTSFNLFLLGPVSYATLSVFFGGPSGGSIILPSRSRCLRVSTRCHGCKHQVPGEATCRGSLGRPHALRHSEGPEGVDGPESLSLTCTTRAKKVVLKGLSNRLLSRFFRGPHKALEALKYLKSLK